jgi:hypothetical protein
LHVVEVVAVLKPSGLSSVCCLACVLCDLACQFARQHPIIIPVHHVTARVSSHQHCCCHCPHTAPSTVPLASAERGAAQSKFSDLLTLVWHSNHHGTDIYTWHACQIVFVWIVSGESLQAHPAGHLSFEFPQGSFIGVLNV